MRRYALPLLLAALALSGCHRRTPKPKPQVSPPASAPAAPVRVLVLREEGDGPAESAKELATLIAHFDERCQITTASSYRTGMLTRYPYVFYLAGGVASPARADFAGDLSKYQGTAAWVGPGVSVLGEGALGHFGLRSGGDAPDEPRPWLLDYGSQQHLEWLAVPSVDSQRSASMAALASAENGGDRRPFIAGSGKLWYAAAGPRGGRDHFWSRCVWADALHDILASKHKSERRLVPVLRDVLVWVSEQQIPKVIRPLLSAGVPVSVLASTKTGEALLSDRPAAVRGLREAESLGAVITLAAGKDAQPREDLRLAWEVGIHPLAWLGPEKDGNPFRLRITDGDSSPPFSAGGLLPAPIKISDAGYIAAQDAERLKMLAVVRDAVALVSLGLWAPPQPFLKFLQSQREVGWRPADLRDLDALVADPRRTVASGAARVVLPAKGHLRKTVFGPRWEQVSQGAIFTSAGSQEPVNAPERSVVALEPIRQMPSRPLLTGITLDPWSYAGQGIAADTLAEALAERYSRNGVNTVFLYAYNVEEGAAYRTRYRGASTSEWGRQDLLGHLLEACRARGIRVVAWLYSGRDRGMWAAHPEWRERTADGKEYNPLRLHATHFLCPRNAEVRSWYAGLVRDLAHRYPMLDGVELCEPLVNWWGDQACYCDVCRREFASAHPGEPPGGSVWRRFRSQGMTGFLSECMRAISDEGVDTYIMTISDAWSNGAILSPRRQSDESGLDLDALLDGPSPPDWVNFELIWQQWAAIYGTEVFNTNWAAETAQQLVRRVDGRARVVFHVELTDFGSQKMTPAKIAETIRRVSVARPDGVECYQSAAADSKAAWSMLKRSFEELR
jgi:hypothetical protein